MNLMTLLKPKGEIEYLHKEDTLRQGLERMRIYGYTAIGKRGRFFMVYVDVSQMRHAGAGELSNQRDYP